MTSSIPQTTPPSAYERFVVTPFSKVARVAHAVFKFIAAMVTWPFKAIYRLFVPSEPKPKEQEGAASTGAVVPPDASTGAVVPPDAFPQAFKLNLDQRGEQDFSTALKELIESELHARPLVEKDELEQITKDSSRSTTLITLEGLKTQNYDRQHFQEFLDFLVASTNDKHLLRSPLYFYLSQTPANLLVGKLNGLLMEKGFYLGTHARDGQQTLKVESLVSELKTESTYTMCIFDMRGEVFKNCVLSLKATINRTTLAVELKATIELKNPAGEVEEIVAPNPAGEVAKTVAPLCFLSSEQISTFTALPPVIKVSNSTFIRPSSRLMVQNGVIKNPEHPHRTVQNKTFPFYR